MRLSAHGYMSVSFLCCPYNWELAPCDCREQEPRVTSTLQDAPVERGTNQAAEAIKMTPRPSCKRGQDEKRKKKATACCLPPRTASDNRVYVSNCRARLQSLQSLAYKWPFLGRTLEKAHLFGAKKMAQSNTYCAKNRELELSPQNPHEKMDVQTYNPSSGEVETGGT